MEAPNYLHFVATFANGTQILQNPEDRSESNPDRNCFFEVLQRQKEVPLVCFVLHGEGYPTFGVDLRDGHFEVNGVPFFQHSEPIQEFRLHYFRNVSQHRTIRVDGTGDPVDTVELGYSIGWEAELKGETVTRYMRIQK
jgi:hypothetical protein